jgi:hypothetical protein
VHIYIYTLYRFCFQEVCNSFSFGFYNIVGLMDIDTSGIASLWELHKNLTSHGMEVRLQ